MNILSRTTKEQQAINTTCLAFGVTRIRVIAKIRKYKLLCGNSDYLDTLINYSSLIASTGISYDGFNELINHTKAMELLETPIFNNNTDGSKMLDLTFI